MWRMARESSLSGSEQPVLLLHPHWKTLIRPILIAVLVVAVALVAVALIPSGSGAAAARGAVGVVAVLVLMVWLIVPVLRWRTTTYELTTKRLRTRFGIITRNGRDIPLTRINDVSFEMGPLDRLLGAGRLVVESAGEHGRILLRDIPNVSDVQATLFKLVEDEQRRLERDERSQP
jgi:membrane protein YdbS with pleckstrin-like domain